MSSVPVKKRCQMFFMSKSVQAVAAKAQSDRRRRMQFAVTPTTTCPGCGKAKSRRAALCADCRKTANSLGVAVLTHVSTPAQPFIPRTSRQNQVYHGRLRELALREKPELSEDKPKLYARERD